MFWTNNINYLLILFNFLFFLVYFFCSLISSIQVIRQSFSRVCVVCFIVLDIFMIFFDYTIITNLSHTVNSVWIARSVDNNICFCSSETNSISKVNWETTRICFFISSFRYRTVNGTMISMKINRIGYKSLSVFNIFKFSFTNSCVKEYCLINISRCKISSSNICSTKITMSNFCVCEIDIC